jgi:hypothetical protein
MKPLKNHYSELSLDEKQLPGIKKLEIGGKYRFEIEADLAGIRMQEDYENMDHSPLKPGQEPRQPKKKPVASFKIVAVEPLGQVKGSKASRY